MIDPNAPTILCFGEVLWDSLPRGLFPGGAPINVAYHARQLGLNAVPVTAVGDDFLGREILRRLKTWELDTAFVTVVKDKPTGIVQAHIGEGGDATYEILEDVAWDRIEVSEELLSLAARSAAIAYGSLAQRSEHNEAQLGRLLARMPTALRAFDVNLRWPFDSKTRVWRLCKDASVIKLNKSEVKKLAGPGREFDTLENLARLFALNSGCDRVCVTAGKEGAGLLLRDVWHWAPSRPITVKDTVGAGDAFLAALVRGLLADPEHPQAILERACRVGEYVASCDGATPAYV